VSAPLSGTIGQSMGSDQMAQLARDLHRMGPKGRRALRRRMKPLGAPLLADARSRASWSTRIPDAISVQPIADENRVRLGVQLRVSVQKAPHARAYEGLSNQGNVGYWRHPLFGDTDRWYRQKTRPFAVTAVLAKAAATREALLGAYEDAAREAGFR